MNQPTPASNGGMDNDKLMGILSYLGILVLVPLLASQNRSQTLNYHVNQGLGLLIVEVIGWIILSFIPVYYLMQIWYLVIIVLAILGIVNVVNNQTKPLPIIGNLFHLIK